MAVELLLSSRSTDFGLSLNYRPIGKLSVTRSRLEGFKFSGDDLVEVTCSWLNIRVDHGVRSLL